MLSVAGDVPAQELELACIVVVIVARRVNQIHRLCQVAQRLLPRAVSDIENHNLNV